MGNSECKPKREGRHRADISGFKIEVVPAENPSPSKAVCRALYEAFEEWRRRKEASK